MLICHANVKFDLLPILTNGDGWISDFRRRYAYLRVISILTTSGDFEKGVERVCTKRQRRLKFKKESKK